MNNQSTAILAIVLLLFGPIIQAQTPSDPLLNLPIQANFQNKNLLEIFSSLEASYPIQFFYKEEWLTRSPKSLSAEGIPLREVMDQLLQGTTLSYVQYGESALIVGRQFDLAELSGFTYESFVKNIGQLDQQPLSERIPSVVIGDSLIRPLPSTARITGAMYDRESEEPLAFARVTFPELGTGTLTNSLGQFTLTLPTGKHFVKFESEGFEPLDRQLLVYSDGKFEVDMIYSAFQMEEVLLEAEESGQSMESVAAGKVEISMIDLRRLPPLMGEIDIINAILLLPGVSSTGEASTGFNVRGGNIDQNLVMQAGNMIFNSSHLFGFFSIFNPDVVSQVSLYKGHIPAQFGGRVSSVLDVDIQDGSFRRTNGTGAIGLFSSRFAINGPLKLKRSSYLLALRAAYPNILTGFVESTGDIEASSAYYGDVTFKVTQKIGEQGKLSLFGYGSQDKFEFSENFGFDWDTYNVGLNYQQIFSENFSLRLDLNAGRYQSEVFNSQEGNASTNTMGVDNLHSKLNFLWVPSYKHTFHAGVEGTLYDLVPNEERPLGEFSSIIPVTAEKDQGLELGIYVNDEYNINNFLSVSLGLRFVNFQNMGPFTENIYEPDQPRSDETVIGRFTYNSGESITSFNKFEPRVSMRGLIDESTSLKLSYNRMHQFIHLLSNTASATPVDIWQVSNNYFPAQQADNFSLGFFKNFGGKAWETSLEGFYRNMQGLVVPKNFAELLGTPNIETEVLNAVGEAYGAELNVKRNFGRFKIEGAFTYARSFRRTEDNLGGENLNDGDWFPSDFDTPLDLALTTQYQFTNNQVFSVSFIYRTGRPISAPENILELYPSWRIPIFSERNQFRIPDYHRLDISYTADESVFKSRKFSSRVTLSFYNVYARQNAYSVYFQRRGAGYSALQVSILGTILPFFSYSFDF
ncbi:MAG: TonB-dependent receptor [Bacteroidota bacterium]